MPTMQQLRGLSIDKAELYGKPHIGARYTAGDRYERIQDRCCICGSKATNCHHVIPKGRGTQFALETPNGAWLLKSPLFALCGSGTTGCHNQFHGGATLKAAWVWHLPLYRDAWWSGELLGMHEPHAEDLYQYGHWVIRDSRQSRTIEIGLR